MNDTAKRWLLFAQEDLQVAELLISQGYYNQTCFHAQQCAENSLKAIICNQQSASPRTHSITDLLNLIPLGLLDNSQGDITALDDYYIPTRYPDALPGSLPSGLPGKEPAEEALQTAQTMFAVAQQWLG